MVRSVFVPRVSDLDDQQQANGKRNIDKKATDVLKAWLLSEEHFAHPYPTIQERFDLADKAGIDPKQVLNWFVNARKRIWQPLLVEMGEDVKKYLSTGRCCSAAKRKVVEAESNEFKRPRLVPPPSLASSQDFSRLSLVKSESSGDIDLENQNGLVKAERVSESSAESDVRESFFTSDDDSMANLRDSVLGYSFTGARKGQWTEEEEAFAHKLILAFEQGTLKLDEGVTLRSFLSHKLNCPPMRISKKFVGKARLGKLLYTPKIFDAEVIKKTEEELLEYEQAFLASVSSDQQDRARSTRAKIVARREKQGMTSSPTGSATSDDSEANALDEALNLYNEIFPIARSNSIPEFQSYLNLNHLHLDGQLMFDLLADGVPADLNLNLLQEKHDENQFFQFDENVTFIDSLPL